MSEKSTNGFKIRLDDSAADHEDVDKPYPKTTQSTSVKMVEPPVRNNGWVPYLLIVIILAAALFGYFDIRKRLLSFHSTGSQETQHLSENLESKFSNLSIKLSSIEESIGSLTEGQTALTGSFSSLKDDLSDAKKSISSVKSSKADKKSTSDSLENIKKDLSAISETLKKNIADTAVMSAKMSATLSELNTLSSDTAEKFNGLKAIVETVDSQKASKKELLTEIDHVENVIKGNQNQNETSLSDIMKSLDRIVSRINALESKTGVQPSVNETVSSPSASPPPSNNTTGGSASTLEPGELIERDISQ
jgi:DNA repair exonuclease SbcCD ATPase subunit